MQRTRDNNLLIVGGMTLADREMADTLQLLSSARADFALKQAEKSEAERIFEDAGGINTITRVMRSEVITHLRRQEAEVMRKIAALVTQFGAQHPQVERTQAELRDLRREVDAEVTRIVQNARNEYDVALSRMQLVEKKLSN